MSREAIDIARKDLQQIDAEYKSLTRDWTSESVPLHEDMIHADRLLDAFDAKRKTIDDMELREGLQTKGARMGDYLNQSQGRPPFATNDANTGLGGESYETDSNDPDEISKKMWEFKNDAERVTAGHARKALAKLVRYGDRAFSLKMNPMEQKALAESVDTEGGYTVPIDFQSELIRRLPEFTFVRGAASVRTTMRDRIVVPRVAAGSSTFGNDVYATGAVITWGGENQNVAKTDITFENVEFLVHKMRAEILVSRDLMDDSAVNVEQEVMEALAESIALAEEQAFIAGSGVQQPLGIMSDPDVSGITSAVAAVIGSDDLYDLQNSMPTQYAGNAVWSMRRHTWSSIRKIKDALGNYMWQPGLERGAPATLLGAPVVLCPFMPDTGTSANKPVLYGDFKYYRIWDRPGMSLQRLNELYSEQDQIGIIVRRRLGAGSILPNAFRILTLL